MGAGTLLFGAGLTYLVIAQKQETLTYRVAVGVGAFGARFWPLGMSRAMFGAALTYVVVTATALVIWPPTAATAEPSVGLANVLGANAALAAGWLFRRAAAGSRAGSQPA